ncbi:MAG: hypothetical protein M3680_16625 [Myxococcota bacterium]|nr:hypothetical protein [Myxococcota bacterium]
MMTRSKLTATLLFTAIAATGCAATVVDDPNDDPSNPDNPDDAPVPLTPEGRFSVQSEFDLATNVPGTAGTVVNYFINATDDPDDPTKFIVDELIKALPAGSIKNTVQNNAPFVTGYLNDRLLQIAPNFLTKLIDVGDAFGQVTKHFGTLETLEINAAGQATKLVTGVHFEIDQVPLDFLFKDYAMADVKVEGLQVTLEPTGKLLISQHKLNFSYGTLLRLALDKAVIPMIDPSAQNLGDILKSAVNCQKVGQFVYESINFGSASTFESACNAGLTAASVALYKQLENIDGSALELGMAGTARGVDKNRDGKMDDIQTGLWTGNLGYAGTPAPLGEAKFFGTKL